MHSTFNVNKQRIREQQQQFANGELRRQARQVNIFMRFILNISSSETISNGTYKDLI